ncbi:LysR family transcriptional regulator [Xylophilus sp.]|uniref:LysR family transcriptional regulator n=1 Tax=Xylophilus sp. TaxID=2653893 RepID=UPI0013BC9D63|nr:LysR family transcriptional regulator [Xylophilus sp.]KAF1044697.1 MAG: Octopine catabolism/uptake operon regulatory protein OccR [Xylophilus sp.]
MINLKHIEVFHAVMQTGSATGAARMLHVTQPAVSAVLKHLEARLQMQLFARVGGRLVPTPEAHALLPDVRGIYGRIEAMERLAQDLAGGRLGTLSVAASSPVTNGWLAKAVSEFLAARPGVRVALQSLASPQVLDRVASREAELGLAYEPVLHPEVVAEVIADNSVACVMPADHPLAARAEIQVADLAPYSLVTYLPQALLRPYVDRALGQAGIAPAIAVQVGLSITGIALAYHGAGIALVEPQLLASLPLPGLVARPLLPRIEVRTLLLLHRDAPRSRLLEDFIAHIRERRPAP